VRVLSRTEGIIPALETAHAIAEAIKLTPKMGKDKIVIVNVSGRGDKDIGIMTREMDLTGAEAKV
jgi:tryptophan synthase beta chain